LAAAAGSGKGGKFPSIVPFVEALRVRKNGSGVPGQAVQRALEKSGVEFTNGDKPGVRMGGRS
jgi:hypothetical protein